MIYKENNFNNEKLDSSLININQVSIEEEINQDNNDDNDCNSLFNSLIDDSLNRSLTSKKSNKKSKKSFKDSDDFSNSEKSYTSFINGVKK